MFVAFLKRMNNWFIFTPIVIAQDDFHIIILQHSTTYPQILKKNKNESFIFTIVLWSHEMQPMHICHDRWQ